MDTLLFIYLLCVSADGNSFGLIERMDYNWLGKGLYFSDTVQKRIFKINLNNTKKPQTLIDLKNADCNGLAVDACGRY